MAKVKGGLGRGLGALMGDAALQTQEAGSVQLPISQVEPGLNQPRKRFDEESLADLSDSIREHGIIQPLTVRRLSTGYYQIIAGERRWRAAKQAGLSEVPVFVPEWGEWERKLGIRLAPLGTRCWSMCRLLRWKNDRHPEQQ